MNKCTICGFQETDPNTKFCMNCGIKLPDKDTPSIISTPPDRDPEIPSGFAIPTRPHLLISGDGAAIYFEENPKVIGRSELSNEIKNQGKDPLQVSRQHFTIHSESNKCYITDGTTFVQENPSSNHTKVNGKDITNQGAIELHDGDQIEIATIFTISFQGPSNEELPSNADHLIQDLQQINPTQSGSSNNQSNEDIVNKYDNMPEL